jgi:hypothetical protein
MRLWSLDPQYLDRQGLLAVWREGLLAKKVLAGKTKGYKNHPQLIRFKTGKNPQGLINNYLFCILEEAQKRGYHFSEDKVKKSATKEKIAVTSGQLEYELGHLLRKLKQRSPESYQMLKQQKKILPAKLFRAVKGKVADWEKV